MDPLLQNGTSDPESRRLALLGATGSVGTQTLEVVRLFPDRFDVRVLTCHQNVERLADQVQEFRPACVVVGSVERAEAFERMLPADAPDVRVLVGPEGLCEAATRSDVDVVLGAVVGFAGLRPVLRAVEAGKQVALANKETLVVGGALVAQALEAGDGRLLPVDSEHSAIFQCLAGESERSVEDLVLTASGGPFWDRPAETFGEITVEEALDHPNWSMGAKITIDSATMMNKGLEVIEAKWLFDVPVDRIQVLVHPQSIVHSMVSFADGAVKAQLGVPDMKVPIQYALSYPARWPAPHERLDWDELSRLDFERPDLDKFPCLQLAYDALEAGGTAPAILNAANEAAVGCFLDEQMGFRDIPRAVERVLERLPVQADPTLEDLVAADTEARRRVEELPLPASN
ncbi:1-deoxy-D-xylulose-5-phosphate reductoisomerase [Salinibacter altiplanensis]|uniref:1-deoxy-D-xylulose-5-phosphate reductoisomerase n=1 Tax=Salinibacter altiplanensis TaxID=1803181 RepID=UPI000C9FAD29|nr:1-deoxy-D-xylulose-5-phosphate reductoisomerase [Salinibacter altiplanensis]